MIEPLVLTTKRLVAQLRQFNQAINQLGRKIKDFSNLILTISSSKVFRGPGNNWLPTCLLGLVRTDLAGLTLPTSKNTPVSLPW
jgi:hypothetical protein